MKKLLILMLPLLFLFFNFNDVHAEPTNVVQTFISNNNMNPTQINGLTTYDISSGTYFILYDFGFQDTSLQKGKTYHVEMNLYGSLGDGYYFFNSDNFDFYGSTDGINQQKLTMINFHMDGTGEYRSLVFDFYLHDNFTHFNLKTSDGNGVIYYQYQGSGKFGWYGLKVNKVADSEDVLKDQNEIIIGQNNQTNKELGDINDSINDTNVDNAKGQASDFFSGFQDNNHGLSGIVTAPLQFLKSLTAAQCTPLHFELPIVHNDVYLPCMKSIYEEHFGVFFSLWQMITTGLISYHVCINLYKKVRDLQNPKNDRIEVLNL